MQKVRLGEYIGQIRGVSYKPTDLHKSLNNDSVILLRANNINEGEINFDDVVYVDKSKVKKEQYLKQGDILVCASSGSKELVGKAAFIKKDIPVTFGAFCKLIRPTGCCAEYLGHYFNSQIYRKKISDLALGANINNIRNEHIDELYLNFPNDLAQKRISEVLDKISLLIDKRKKQLTKLDELVKSRFVEMFGDPENNTLSWKEEKLSEHLTVIGGYAFKSEQFSEEGIPVLRIGNINSGFFKPVNLVYWEDDDALSRYKMYPDDLVISLTGTVGKDDYGNVCILGNDYDVYYLNQRNAKLELQDTINKYYLSMLLKFGPVKKKLTGISRGVRQANISNKDILNLSVPIPPIELQNQFAAFVKQTDKLKSSVQKSLESLETLKQAQMQKYFG